jgi:flagellar biosynthesis chaperone FliJ
MKHTLRDFIVLPPDPNDRMQMLLDINENNVEDAEIMYKQLVDAIKNNDIQLLIGFLYNLRILTNQI